MSDKLRLLAQEGNPANKGIIVSTIIIIAGLFPNIEINLLRIYIPLDSWLLILVGLSSLFYFFSVKVNQDEDIDEKGKLWIRTPSLKSKLSKECFNISIIIFIIFIIRGGYLFLIRLT